MTRRYLYAPGTPGRPLARHVLDLLIGATLGSVTGVLTLTGLCLGGPSTRHCVRRGNAACDIEAGISSSASLGPAWDSFQFMRTLALACVRSALRQIAFSDSRADLSLEGESMV